METENVTLKPIPPKILYCKTCKSDFNFISYLKMNAEFYKTCSECRHKIRLQNRRFRSTYKHTLTQ
jgi:DNA-directed RNA polymerase subunit RPC12/RpoP